MNEDILEKELSQLNILPISSVWASPLKKKTLPGQGFKIHISATILNCVEILKKTAPYLLADRIHFKVIRNKQLLMELNSGMQYYSQIGKFMTIYPTNPSDAFELAKKMDEITCEFQSISIPGDLRFSKNSNVFIRYGVINSKFLRDGKGKLHDDKRNQIPIPHWVEDNPFKEIKPPLTKILEEKRIIITKVLRQRGKGGVYESLQLPSSPKEKTLEVILKEGRRLGEVDEKGICGLSFIKNESKALKILEKQTFTPRLLDEFSVENGHILVLEKCEGASLSKIITRSPGRDTCQSIVFGLSKIIQKCHRMGIYIYDLSPDNIILGRDMFVVDWEMAVFNGSTIPPKGNMGKKGFFVPSYEEKFDEEKLVERDVFAFSRIMYALLNPSWYGDVISSTNRNAFDFLSLPRMTDKKSEQLFLDYFGKITTYYPVL